MSKSINSQHRLRCITVRMHNMIVPIKGNVLCNEPCLCQDNTHGTVQVAMRNKISIWYLAAFVTALLFWLLVPLLPSNWPVIIPGMEITPTTRIMLRTDASPVVMATDVACCCMATDGVAPHARYSSMFYDCSTTWVVKAFNDKATDPMEFPNNIPVMGIT